MRRRSRATCCVRDLPRLAGAERRAGRRDQAARSDGSAACTRRRRCVRRARCRRPADTRLQALLGNRRDVKSHRRQGLGRWAPASEAARAPDGTIEALEDPSRRFISASCGIRKRAKTQHSSTRWSKQPSRTQPRSGRPQRRIRRGARRRSPRRRNRCRTRSIARRARSSAAGFPRRRIARLRGAGGRRSRRRSGWVLLRVEGVLRLGFGDRAFEVLEPVGEERERVVAHGPRVSVDLGCDDAKKQPPGKTPRSRWSRNASLRARGG